jgi:hypothetical protein
MNPEKRPEVTVETLLALRKEDDAVRLITERLRVKEMGPADHIRTKHEVKAFVEVGTHALAEALVVCAKQRRNVNQTISTTVSERHGQRIGE